MPFDQSNPEFLGEIDVAVVASVSGNDNLVAVDEFDLLNQARVGYFVGEVEVSEIEGILLDPVEVQHILNSNCENE